MNIGFELGSYVTVTPKDGDLFTEEFAGIIVSHRNGNWGVQDMEENVWEVDEDQLELLD
jgi:hypothetical protein